MPIVLKSGSLNLLETSGSVEACNGIAFCFLFCFTLRLSYPQVRAPIIRRQKLCGTHTSERKGTVRVNLLTYFGPHDFDILDIRRVTKSDVGRQAMYVET